MILSPASAAEKILRGEIVALPTETVYGLAALAENPEAVTKIFAAKNRPPDNPLICHVDSLAMIREYAAPVPDYLDALVHHFSPGPLSFLLHIPENSPLRFATAGRASCIFRIPRHPLFLRVIQQVRKPLAAPSANTSGHVSPTTAQMVESDLGNKISGTVDGGPCAVGIESTILDCRESNRVAILRTGKIGKEELEKILSPLHVDCVTLSASRDSTDNSTSEKIPGESYRHYAPKTKLILIARSAIQSLGSNDLLIASDEDLHEWDQAMQTPSSAYQRGQAQPTPRIPSISLGSVSRPDEMARHLYQNLSRVDSLQVPKAFLVLPELDDSSLSDAIIDRLRKASAL